MRKLFVVLFAFIVACDITQPIAPTPGDSEVINQININISGDDSPEKRNRAPIITLPSSLENIAGDDILLQVSVFDPDNDLFACTSFIGPRGLSISPSCLITGTITPSSGGEVFTTIVEASDGLATGRGQTEWTVLEP